MSDPQPDLSTNDLLRMIGKELQGIRRECRKTANWVQVLGVLALVGLIVGFLAAGSVESSP